MSDRTRFILQLYWGYPSFRPMQEEIVDSVKSGKDTLALLPTGGGKSICFQVPTMTMVGVCIVITPLIALMKDQVAHLNEKELAAAAIYSGMHPDAIELVYNQAIHKRLKFLYVSPERLQSEAFIEALKQMQVCLIAVDEAHCISQWGYDFRPPYLKIADIRQYAPEAPVLALTATATAKVVKDIQLRLGFKEWNVFQTSFERKNLTYNVCHESDKYGVLRRKLEALTEGCAIVYVRSRKRTHSIADWLNSVGISATFYHAGLDTKTRDAHQNLWMKGKVKVIVATNAFGMGIDKPDVRLVVHIDLPDSLEAYFQEAGRAGRDQKPSESLLLVSPEDIRTLQENLKQSFPDLERIKTIYNALGNYYQIPIGAGENVSYPFVLEEFAHHYGFNVLEVFHTMRLLEKEGFLTLSDNFDEPSKVMVKASRDEVYNFQVSHPEFDPLIKYMFRGLPGLMTDFVRINEEMMARKLGLPVDKLIGQLKKLEAYHFLSYEQRSDKPQLRFLSEFVDTRHFGLSKENYHDRKKDAEQRVKSVIDFVNNDKECRSAQLLRYFNEKTRKHCGCCDVCVKLGNKRTPDAVIEKKLKDVINYEPTPYHELMNACKNYGADEVLDTMRALSDDYEIRTGKDFTVQWYRKKSRR